MLKATEQPLDPGTGTAPAKAFLDTLGVGEFEANLGRERRLEGIVDGVYNGRKTDDRCRRSLVAMPR